MPHPLKFARDGTARALIEGFLDGMRRDDLAVALGVETFPRQKVSRWKMEDGFFEAAAHIAEASIRIGELAEEMDDAMLRDLHGFMKAVALEQLELFEQIRGKMDDNRRDDDQRQAQAYEVLTRRHPQG